MVRWSRSTWPLVCGRPARISSAERCDRVAELVGELVAVIGQDALQTPAGLAQGASDALREAAGLALVGARAVAADEFGPREGAVGVDRGELPDRALGAVEPTDVETVDADQLTRPGRVDVRLGRRLARRLVRRPVAGEQTQALGTRGQTVASQRLIDAVGRDDQPAPLRPREHRGNPPRPQPWMPERERDDPLLEDLRKLVGHHRPPALTRPEHLQSLTVDLRLPAVIRRAMHTHQPARLADPTLPGEREQLQAIAEQHVIMRHAAAPFAWR
jgi:hypothetical protein